MVRHYKDIFSDAYYEAIENGSTVEEAERIGLDAITDHQAARADAAKDAAKERGL